MSQANVEIVRRSFDAFIRGDFEEAMREFHPDIAYDLTHISPDGQLYEGHEGVRTGMRRWLGAWAEYRMEVDEYVDAGDSVVILFRESGRGKGSGVRIEQSVAGVWALRDGKVVRVTPFLDRSEARRAAGLESDRR
jgi:ketosteroid isomerase-like protein